MILLSHVTGSNEKPTISVDRKPAVDVSLFMSNLEGNGIPAAQIEEATARIQRALEKGATHIELSLMQPNAYTTVDKENGTFTTHFPNADPPDQFTMPLLDGQWGPTGTK